MNSNILLPTKIKVGFNPRTDTYTGKLGYVIYHDGKVWRKEKSWESWRYKVIDPVDFKIAKQEVFDKCVSDLKGYHADYVERYKKDPTQNYVKQYAEMSLEEFLKHHRADNIKKFQYNPGNTTSDKSLEPVEYANEPTEGFVLNRKAGGTRGHSWETRDTYCRVYDPRGFEFEISIPNLLYILENTSSFVGKGLEGKFVYGWQGTELILIPENAPEYQEMIKFNELIKGKVSKKELTPGNIYINKDNDKVVYLDELHTYDSEGRQSAGKTLFFYNLKYAKSYTDKSCRHYAIQGGTVASLKKDTGEQFDKYAEIHGIMMTKTGCKVPEEILQLEYVKHDVNTLQKEWDDAKRKYSYNRAIPVHVKNKTKGYSQIYLWYVDDYVYIGGKREKRTGWYVTKKSWIRNYEGLEVFEKLYDFLVIHEVYKEVKVNKKEKV